MKILTAILLGLFMVVTTVQASEQSYVVDLRTNNITSENQFSTNDTVVVSGKGYSLFFKGNKLGEKIVNKVKKVHVCRAGIAKRNLSVTRFIDGIDTSLTRAEALKSYTINGDMLKEVYN